MDDKTDDHTGDQFAQDCKHADDCDNRPVYSAGKVDGYPKEDKKHDHKNIPERPGMLLEGIGVRRGKGRTQRDHHQGLRNSQIEGDRRRGENCCKRKEDGNLIIALKDGDEEFLSVKGHGIDKAKGKHYLDREEQEVLVACRENGKDDNQDNILKNGHPDDRLGLHAHQFPVLN